MSKWFPGILFWGWNSVFILFVALLLFSGLIPVIFMAALGGNIPISFILSILLLVIVPILAITLSVRRKDRHGGFLLKLFFGVELPIFLVALMRLFVLRQMTPGTTLLLISILAACSYFLWSLYEEKFQIRSRLGATAHAIPSTIMLVFGTGAAIFLAIYAAPAAVALIKFVWRLAVEFFSFHWLSNLESLLAGGYFAIVLLVFLVLFVFSSVVFVVAPIFMVKYYSQTWRRVKLLAAPHIGGTLFLLLSLIVGGAWIGAYVISGHHQEAATVAWLEEQETLADVRDNIEIRRENIRHDLVNAYLFRYRYLQTRGSTDGIARMYQSELNFPADAANVVQSLHHLILTPLLYAGKSNDDKSAGKLYQEIFDIPIQDAERTSIKKALQATWNRDEAEAGLLDINSKKVFIREQHITVEDFETHASIEIEEIYENQTAEQQEIYYYFSLPEDAAITGLWLGFGADRSKHDKFVVAPRGAAQEIYEREVQRRVDPALLEQVGPRQYRLRAFPVPPKRIGRVSGQAYDETNRLRMRFTYAAPKSAAEIASPLLLEKRNVFWSGKTIRTLNSVALKETNWLPRTLPVNYSRTPIDANIILEQGYKVTRSTQPASDETLSVAILIDTSWSVRRHDQELKQQINTLKQDPTIEGRVFFIGANGVSSVYSPLASYDPDQALSYFGSLSPQQILSQFETMKPDRAFDAIIILTDQGRYVADDSFTNANIIAPLWFVHIGLPAYAYDDAILDLIYRSGGGVATSIDEAIQGARASAEGIRLSEGRAWRVEKPINGEEYTTSSITSSLAAIAARQVVLSLTKGAKNDLTTLDNIHSLAVANDIVTPWSSMIVLVSERQRKALEEASDDADRFSREANTGEENLTAPTVTGVPEPHEWMLIIIAALMLLVLWRRHHTLAQI
jgi:putative PEP-CTERM system integral membrane protein